MYIKSIKVKNFFSIGEHPVFIDFTKYGNIILLKGKNFDVNEDSPTSNASGKSSAVIESIVYALYGKTIRNLSHNDIINKTSKKGLEVDIRFDDYRILRTRKPDSLRVWHNDKEITLGGIPATQDLLDGIIKLSYNSFINVACFGQHNVYDFLSCAPGVKRKIVENLLSLEKYNTFCDSAKEEYKNINTQIKENKIVYEGLCQQEESFNKKLHELGQQETSWITKKQLEIEEQKSILKIKKQQLLTKDNGQKIILYEQAQTEIKELGNQISTLDSNKEKCMSLSTSLYDKLEINRNKENEINNRINTKLSWIDSVKKDIQHYEKEIKLLENLEDGATCSVCFGIVSTDNYGKVIQFNKQRISTLTDDNSHMYTEIASDQDDLKNVKNNIVKIITAQADIKNKIKNIDAKISQSKQKIKELTSINKPEISNDDKLIHEQMSSLEDRIFEIKNELSSGNPYKYIIQTINSELKTCNKNIFNTKSVIDELSSELPYYDFWINGFGDNGIRSFIIDDVVPTLNDRVAYYLNYLVDGKIKLTFDNNLNETIERCPNDGNEFVYNSLSGGEKKKTDIAVSMAFSFITSVSSGKCPSILFLDEVGEFIDEDGLYGIYNLICELSQDRQIIIVTHNQFLLELFENCETITVCKKNGLTTLE